jgi:hypothetical protein
MIAIVTLLVAVPLGYLVRSRLAAYVAYGLAFAHLCTLQTLALLPEWSASSDDAFDRDGGAALDHLLVNTAICAAGLGLVTLGARLRARRTSGLDLAPGAEVTTMPASAVSASARRRSTAWRPARCWLAPVTTLALVACSAPAVDDTADAEPTGSAPMTSTAPEGFPVVAADAVQEQRWRLPGGPDWLAADDADVWIKRDDGTVNRIAPDTWRDRPHGRSGRRPVPGPRGWASAPSGHAQALTSSVWTRAADRP